MSILNQQTLRYSTTFEHATCQKQKVSAKIAEHLKILGFISLLVLTAIGCGVQSFCRKNNSDDELYANGGAGSFLRGDRYKHIVTLLQILLYHFTQFEWR